MILTPSGLEAVKKKYAWLKTTTWFQEDWSFKALLAHAESTVGEPIKILKGYVDAPPPETFKARELGCTCRPSGVINAYYELSSSCPIHYLPLVEDVYIKLGSPRPEANQPAWSAKELLALFEPSKPESE